MCELEGRGNSQSDFKNLLFGDFSLRLHRILQAGLVQMLHHQVKTTVLFAQGEHADDIGVGKRCGYLNLLKKLCGEQRIFS